MNYTHPRSEVKITDNSFTGLAPAPTGLDLFTPVFSEKGIDNQVQFVSTPQDYLAQFGKLDFRNHGQLGYNALSWLESGGGAFILRLLPEDATYSHAIIDIQTKTLNKKVLDVNGEKVELPDVHMRPVAMHMRGANTTGFLSNSLKEGFNKTIDGYNHNPFARISVRGRGRYYNRYSFRINVLNEFDETYDFRTYSFESLYTDQQGKTSVIEGPFAFSFDPNAKNISGSSLFLPNVLSSYSEYFDAEVNVEVLNKIIDTINPNGEAPGRSIDVLSGSTRIINGEREKFFSKATKKEEDIHISLHEYNSGGYRINLGSDLPKLNIVDTTSDIQKTILEIDDTKRDLQHIEIQKSVEDMLVALSRFRSGAYSTHMRLLVDFDEDQNLVGGKIKYYHDKYQEAVENVMKATEAFNEEQSDENFEKLLKVNDIALDRIKDLKAISLEITSTARAIASTPNLLEAILEIKTADQLLGLNEATVVGAASKIDSLLNMNEIIHEAKQIPASDAKIEAVEEILLDADEVIRFAVAMDLEDQKEADEALELAKEQREATFLAYQECIDEYVLPSELDTYVKEALTQSELFVKSLRKAIDMVLVENTIQTIKEADTRMNKLVIETLQAAKDSERIANSNYENLEMRKDMEKLIKDHIDRERSKVKENEYNRYLQVLKDLSADIVFLQGGSEGSLEDENLGVVERTKKNLLIKAFKGQIDPSVTDPEILEFDVLLDGNLDADVKDALVSLATNIRDDIFAFTDLNLPTSPKMALEYRRNRLAYDSNRVAIYSQPLVRYDESTNMDINLSSTHLVASMLPNNEQVYGLHQPLAGRVRGVVSGYKSIGWYPAKEWKTNLYNAQINYIEVRPDKMNLATQSTSQRSKSALSNINNMLMVLRLKRQVHKTIEEHRMEIVDEAFLTRLNRDLQSVAKMEMDTGAYKSVEASAFANEYDLANNVYRVRYVVRFKDIVHTILGNIEVEN